jgi:hypothetical protein
VLQGTMLRNSAIYVSLLTICLGASEPLARAMESSPPKSNAESVEIWTDGFAKSDADKIFGLALGLNGPLRFDGKVGLQQHADPHLADTEKLVWSIAMPAAHQLSHSVDLNVSSGGALDSLHGSYIQSLTGTLAWTAQSTSELTSKLQLKSNLALDVGKASSTLVVGPEWVFAVRSIGSMTRTRTEVKAGVDYSAPTNGVASLVAKVELSFTPAK